MFVSKLYMERELTHLDFKEFKEYLLVDDFHNMGMVIAQAGVKRVHVFLEGKRRCMIFFPFQD